MYNIVVSYWTGDSFGSEDDERELPFVWTNIEIAGNNLGRIKEHYDWYQDLHNTWKRSPKTVSKPEFSVDEYTLKLMLDDGSEKEIGAFWCGYFEGLHSASIKLDMKEGR